MAGTTGFVARRRCLAALRATTARAVLQRLDGRRLLHVLEAWAADGEAEGHATFLEELMRVGACWVGGRWEGARCRVGHALPRGSFRPKMGAFRPLRLATVACC
jgi:hypothetical protein